MTCNKETAGDTRTIDSVEGALERLGEMDRGRSFAECLGLVNGVLLLLSFVRDCAHVHESHALAHMHEHVC